MLRCVLRELLRDAAPSHGICWSQPIGVKKPALGGLGSGIGSELAAYGMCSAGMASSRCQSAKSRTLGRLPMALATRWPASVAVSR